MTYCQTLADLLRGLADRIDPPPPELRLPQPGDALTIVLHSIDEAAEIPTDVVTAWTDETGQAITRLVVREVWG